MVPDTLNPGVIFVIKVSFYLTVPTIGVKCLTTRPYASACLAVGGQCKN